MRMAYANGSFEVSVVAKVAIAQNYHRYFSVPEVLVADTHFHLLFVIHGKYA